MSFCVNGRGRICRAKTHKLPKIQAVMGELVSIFVTCLNETSSELLCLKASTVLQPRSRSRAASFTRSSVPLGSSQHAMKTPADESKPSMVSILRSCSYAALNCWSTRSQNDDAHTATTQAALLWRCIRIPRRISVNPHNKLTMALCRLLHRLACRWFSTCLWRRDNAADQQKRQ